MSKETLEKIKIAFSILETAYIHESHYQKDEPLKYTHSYFCGYYGSAIHQALILLELILLEEVVRDLNP